MSTALKPLVIGIGNLQRGDDSAGYRIAAALQDELAVPCRVIASHQLMPEFAEPIATASRVLFIDSTIDPERCLRWSSPQLEPLGCLPLTKTSLSHQGTPQDLLALAEALYSSRPPAWQLLIPSLNWEHGVELSLLTSTAAAMAVPLVRAWGSGHA